MEVVSVSPLPVGSVLWQHRPGSWALTIVAKATFLLQPGLSRLAEQQEPIHGEDNHWNDDPGRSLFSASDLVPVKPRADVTLIGSAYAPQGQPVNGLYVRLIVGELDKSIEVTRDRTMGPDGAIAEEGRFARMPLLYERAGGGPDTSNPVGVRPDTRDSYGRVKLPNLLPPGVMVAPGSIVPPIGFGPIAPTWPSRWNRLGKYAGQFVLHQLASTPLPMDFDRGFFNDAPNDQQLTELSDDVRIVLENLHPQAPRLVTNLPGLRPRAILEARGGSNLALRCDSLWINTDQAICTLTWRGHITLERADEPGRILIGLDEASGGASQKTDPFPRAVAADSTAANRARASSLYDPDETGNFPAPQNVALPFVRAPIKPPPDERRMPAGGLPFGPPPAPASPPPNPAPALPFRQPAPSWPGTPAPPAPNVPPPPVGMAASAARATSTQWPAITPHQPPPVPPIQPPPPVPQKVAPVKPTDESVWAAGTSRPEVPTTGQSIGQLAAAAAATATQAPPVDGAAGVLAASTAAAGTTTNSPAIAKRTGERASQGGATTSNATTNVRPSGKLDNNEHLHLIWFSQSAVRRICRVPVWRSIIDEMERERSEEAHDSPFVAQDPDESEDTRDIFDILARGATQDVDQLEAELAAAVRPGGKFVPPLLLLAGELSLPFDERECLKAAIAAATPVAGTDEIVKSALREAKEFLAGGEACPPVIVDGYTARIREAIGRGRKALTPEALDAHVERVVLDGRHYQQRQVLGMNAIRGLLHTTTSTGSRPAPLYMPDDLAKKLPLYSRFRARVIVELYIQEDQHEAHPAALKVRALGRVHSFPEKK